MPTFITKRISCAKHIRPKTVPATLNPGFFELIGISFRWIGAMTAPHIYRTGQHKILTPASQSVCPTRPTVQIPAGKSLRRGQDGQDLCYIKPRRGGSERRQSAAEEAADSSGC